MLVSVLFLASVLNCFHALYMQAAKFKVQIYQFLLYVLFYITLLSFLKRMVKIFKIIPELRILRLTFWIFSQASGANFITNMGSLF